MKVKGLGYRNLHYTLTPKEQDLVDLMFLQLHGKDGIETQNDIVAMLINNHMNFMLEMLMVASKEGIKYAS